MTKEIVKEDLLGKEAVPAVDTALPSGRRAGRLLTVAAVVAAAAASGLLLWGMPLLERLDCFILHRLDMKGDTAKVPLARIKEVAEPVVAGRTFFTVDLEAVRSAVEELPWVRSASVRRIWPDRLEVDVDVHEAVAQFEDGRLVSSDGVLFSANPEEGSETVGLPAFSCAPEDVPELLRRYRRFSRLLAGLPVRVTELTLTDRGGWRLTFQGTEIPPTRVELGRESAGSSVEARLRQIAAAYPSIQAVLGGPPSSLDARYRGAIAAGKVDREAIAALGADDAGGDSDDTDADAASASAVPGMP